MAPAERRVDHERREDTSELARREVEKKVAEVMQNGDREPQQWWRSDAAVRLLALLTATLIALSLFIANVVLVTTLRSATTHIDQLEQQIDELRGEVTVLRAQVRELGGEPRRPDGDS